MSIIANTQAKPSLSAASVSGRIGTLSTRLACTRDEIKTAQRIRYKVFCEEMSARKNVSRRITRRDRDAHDKHCDHLLVTDLINGQEKIVGTQRFFVKSDNTTSQPFYSQSEFDLDTLASRHPRKRFMELGRSCILPEYRCKRTMELMWHGTWAYALQQRADVMIGCASFEASGFQEIAACLGFLSEHAQCDDAWDTVAVAKNAMPLSKFRQAGQNPKRALASLPPLIKGYLRLGAKFASQAVPDPDFGTIDILVVLPVETINPRYVNYYGADAGRHKH